MSYGPRNDGQLAVICQALCDRMRIGECFRPVGPGLNVGEMTEKGVKLLKRCPLSHGETLMFQIAVALWNGGKVADLYHMMHVFDARHLRAVGTLLVAWSAGDVALDKWLEAQAEEVQRGR
jgi:hypothetical protein